MPTRVKTTVTTPSGKEVRVTKSKARRGMEATGRQAMGLGTGTGLLTLRKTGHKKAAGLISIALVGLDIIQKVFGNPDSATGRATSVLGTTAVASTGADMISDALVNAAVQYEDEGVDEDEEFGSEFDAAEDERPELAAAPEEVPSVVQQFRTAARHEKAE
jgi:hypothetical protein